jgi:hypothetical protein
MRRSRPQSLSNVAGSKRFAQLAAAFAAFRREHGPRRWIPLGLRRQFLAALDVERLQTLSVWHKKLAKRHGRMVKVVQRKLMRMPVDPELDEDEPSEEEKAETAAEVRRG